ncbi:MAG: hypothetical protein ACLU9X_09325, partial [Alistipes shahii]
SWSRNPTARPSTPSSCSGTARTKKIYSNVDSKIVQNNGRDVFIGEGFRVGRGVQGLALPPDEGPHGGRNEAERRFRGDGFRGRAAGRGSGNGVNPCPRTPAGTSARNRS